MILIQTIIPAVTSQVIMIVLMVNNFNRKICCNNFKFMLKIFKLYKYFLFSIYSFWKIIIGNSVNEEKNKIVIG